MKRVPSVVKFLLPLFVLALLVSCTPGGSDTQLDTYGNGTTSSSSMTSPVPAGFDGKLLSGKHTVVMHTSKGDITLEIDANSAPKAATNFLVLSRMGYYNGLTFHRVIPNFMIQGGDPDGRGTGGTSIFGDDFEDEPNDLQMVRGVLAMANRGPDTNGSQFFIVQAKDGTPWLQGLHTIFGKVTSGMEVVDAIASVERDARDMPVTPVTYEIEVKN